MDDVRVLEIADGGEGGDDLLRSPRRKKKRIGGGGEEDRNTAAAARRAATEERRAAAKSAREAAAERKRAERTRAQARAQALKLGRKMHAALAQQQYGGAATTPTSSSSSGGGLVLAPIVSRPNGELELLHGGDAAGAPGRFERSFQTLYQIATAAPPPPLPPVSSSSPSSPAAATLLPGTPVRLPGVPVPPLQQAPLLDESTSSSHALLLPVPSYGALRGGALPTYREYVAQQENRAPPRRNTRAELELELTEDQRREQARLEHELQELAVTQQYENLTRLYNTLPELRRKPIVSSTRRASLPSAVLRARSVPQQRRTVRRVFHVGRTDKEISLLTHSAATRAGVDDFRLHVQSLSTDKMRRALMAAKLLRAGSEAPEPLVRRMFQQRQMLVGDLLVVGSGHDGGSDVVPVVQ